jgi:hypothetical protein
MRRRTSASCHCVLLSLALLAGACDGGKTIYVGRYDQTQGQDAQVPDALNVQPSQDALVGPCGSGPGSVPPALGLDPFYSKYLDAGGVPVVSSSQVADLALVKACRITTYMLSARADVRGAFAATRQRVAVIGQNEVLTNLPEYADLYTNPPLGPLAPGTDWNKLRSLSPSFAGNRPITSTGEENLLCLQGDAFAGETILAYMLGDAMRTVAIDYMDLQFESRLQAAWMYAGSKGLWVGSRALLNPQSYWAIGCEVWFGTTTLEAVTTRVALTTYDPGLAALLSPYMPGDSLHGGCYTN